MNKFVNVLWLLIALAVSWSCHARSESAVGPQYAALLENAGPGNMWLAPDQQWLVMGDAAQFQAQQQLDPRWYFFAAGKALHRQQALEKDTPEFADLQLLNLKTRAMHRLSFPAPSFAKHKFVAVHWSPDSSQLALVVRSANKLSLWHYHLAAQQLRPWSAVAVSAQLGAESLVWLPDSSAVVVRQSLMQPQSSAAEMPGIVLKSSQDTAQSRVYRDALDSEDRRRMFRQLSQQRAVLIDVTGQLTPLTAAGMLEDLSISPDGRYLLLQLLDDDLHPAVKFSRLGRRYQVIDLHQRKLVAEPAALGAAELLARQPDAAAAGTRLIQWLPGAPASLVWAEAVELQGHRVTASVRDQVRRWDAPFHQPSQLLFQTSWRLFQLSWTVQGRAIYSDFHAGTKQLRNWSWLAQTAQSPGLLHQTDYSNAFTSAGELVTVRQPTGVSYALADQHQAVFFSAGNPNRYGEYAVVTRHGLAKDQQEQVFSDQQKQQLHPMYIRLHDDNVRLLLTRNQPDRAPSLFWWTNGQLAAEALHDWHTSTRPVLPQARPLKYRRADGVELSSLLYLPDGPAQQKYPVLIWLYPREHETHQQQQQLTSHQHSYSPMQPLTADFALLEGFAVLDASNAPIVAGGQQLPNDSYVKQQQLNAAAMVAALSETGVIDTNQMYLLGHSYGAFSAVSLLATTDYFHGAIARSGAYNRSLTPLGFQSEKRTLWQAPDLYLQLSPFFQADRIKAPILLIHGTDDQNAGTSLLQSELMFQALQALGKDAELLLLPGEGHQYQGRENLLQMLQIQARWLKQQLAQQQQAKLEAVQNGKR